MLIVVSDFHLMDGSAGGHYVDAGVFRSTMYDLAAHAREAEPEDITLVFLGDVFDLFRTERWFEVELDARPWGTNPSDEVLYDIFEAVVDENEETFAILAGSLVEHFDFPVEPKRIYIPGNHDRLVNDYPRLRRRVREILGITHEEPEAPFAHHILDLEHGVLMRHGHEWDDLNFEGSEALDSMETIEVPDEDYRQMAIGDVVACEFAAKIGPLAASFLPEDHPHRARIAERMRDIADVKPLVAMVEWASWQVGQWDKVEQNAVKQAFVQAAKTTRELPFVQEWVEKHDRLGMDRADKFQMMMWMFKNFRPKRGPRDRVLKAADRVTAMTTRDPFVDAALKDFERLDRYPDIAQQIYYVMYGHTHVAKQRPLQVLGEAPNERYRVYFNTGTWRPTHRSTPGGHGFASWKEITYTFVYKPGETVSGGIFMDYPAVESWTGVVVVGRGRRATVYQRIPTILRNQIKR
jgi:UDP-2,3-diacylglucosamine pyrophosphatase LpxH